jgi:hypothetical protein
VDDRDREPRYTREPFDRLVGVLVAHDAIDDRIDLGLCGGNLRKA